MRKFRNFAFLSTLLVYLVIFAGGLVRVSGAGLGCPDWPKCFGSWIPPTSIEQLPPDIDPSQFNFTLAWIEYVNRLVGMFLGFMIAATAVWALAKYRKIKGIVLPSVAAAILVAVQGWHGSVVVASELDQPTVSVHLLLALLIAGLMIFLTLRAHNIEKKYSETVPIPMNVRYWSALILILAFIQIMMGTEVRSILEILATNSPLLTDAQRIASVGLVNHLHLVLGFVVAVLTWVFVLLVLKRDQKLPPIIKTGSAIATIVVFVQIVIGMGFVTFGIPPLLQIFHLWTASIFIGILFVIFSATIIKTER